MAQNEKGSKSEIMKNMSPCFLVPQTTSSPFFETKLVTSFLSNLPEEYQAFANICIYMNFLLTKVQDMGVFPQQYLQTYFIHFSHWFISAILATFYSICGCPRMYLTLLLLQTTQVIPSRFLIQKQLCGISLLYVIHMSFQVYEYMCEYRILVTGSRLLF